MFKVTPRVYYRRERLFWFRLDSRDKEGRRKRKSLHPTRLHIHQTKRKDTRGRLLPGYVNTGTQQIILKLVLNHFVCFFVFARMAAYLHFSLLESYVDLAQTELDMRLYKRTTEGIRDLRHYDRCTL